MQYKHSVIQQVGDTLFYERNKEEKPQEKGFMRFSVAFRSNKLDWHSFEAALKEWQSSLETFEVHESQKERFIDLAKHAWLTSDEIGVFADFLKHKGISIPSERVEIKSDKHLLSNPPKPVYFAYLKEDKEETQEDLWKELFEIFYDTRIKYYQAEQSLKSKFEIKRK